VWETVGFCEKVNLPNRNLAPADPCETSGGAPDERHAEALTTSILRSFGRQIDGSHRLCLTMIGSRLLNVDSRRLNTQITDISDFALTPPRNFGWVIPYRSKANTRFVRSAFQRVLSAATGGASRPTIGMCCGAYRSLSTSIREAASVIALRSVSVSSILPAPIFSSSRWSLVVPGIGTIGGRWARSHASAI
jgi:hypothetical protein